MPFTEAIKYEVPRNEKKQRGLRNGKGIKATHGTAMNELMIMPTHVVLPQIFLNFNKTSSLIFTKFPF